MTYTIIDTHTMRETTRSFCTHEAAQEWLMAHAGNSDRYQIVEVV